MSHSFLTKGSRPPLLSPALDVLGLSEMNELAQQIKIRIGEYLAADDTSAEMHKVAASMAALPL
jgi:hypothetical protein